MGWVLSGRHRKGDQGYRQKPWYSKIKEPKKTFDNFARDFGERLCPGDRALLVIDFLTNAPFDE
jgi:hypothetical protein